MALASIKQLIQPAPVDGITTVQLSYLSWLESQDTEQYLKYQMFRDYYEGEHLTQLNKRMRKFLQLQDDQEFSLNFCPIVVDSLAEKLKVAKFQCDDKPDVLDAWWTDMGQQGVVHLAAVRDGDTYVLVEYDNDAKCPKFTHENAYNGAEGTHVVYSDENHMEPVVAIKRWQLVTGVGTVTRRTNLYYPDRIEKYSDFGSGTTWGHHEEDGQPWPIPWVANGVPLGIPVIHFRNKDQGYSYGESELEDVTPMENALNKTVIDLLAAADTTAFRLYTMTGAKPPTTQVAPGSWLYSEAPGSAIGSIAPADLSGLIALKDSIALDIARLTRTPLSNFQITGQVAAEGTLKEQRAGLTAKARDRQTSFGASWVQAMTMARKLYNFYGSGGMDESKRITVEWEDDEKPDIVELANAANLLHTAESASTATRVQLLHPDWTEKEVADEVQLIQTEAGMLVPDIGTVG